ncbi:MAG: hypothetical protein AAB091_04235 [Elusimicrobiota bacterium]
MSVKSHLIECPFCRGTLEVGADSGKVLQKWPSGRLQGGSPEERFGDALKKMDEAKKKREDYFSNAASEMQDKKKKAQRLFEEQVKKIKKEGLETPPERPFDFD